MTVKQQIRYGALAVLASAGLSGAAYADSAKTLGGIVVTSDDGNFVASLGGRIQFDYTGIFTDKHGNAGFDSGDEENDSGFYFRRVYITLTGKVYGWRYRIDEDISNTSNPAAGFKYVFVSHDFAEYGTVRVGQAKPWRSMDELASDLDTPFMERNANSASGLYGGRQYTQGVFARYSRPGVFGPYDRLWAGASVYSLNSAGASTNEGTGTPTAGLGYNARLAYAPIVQPGKWLHFGANLSNEHADNGASLTVAESAWYSYKGVTQTLASFAGSPQPTSTSLANLGGGNNPTANIIQAEAAGDYGPLYLQAEFGTARLSQPTASAKGVPNVQNVYAISGEASYYLTGESREYDPDMATYIKPKIRHDYGAVELAVGYNFVKNRDLPAGNTSVCKPSLGTIPTGTTITRCDVSYFVAGVNYHVNNNVKFMLNYDYGVYDAGAAGKDEPKAINARMQISF
jgi:phosphate-selective porin OprO and OprP